VCHWHHTPSFVSVLIFFDVVFGIPSEICDFFVKNKPKMIRRGFRACGRDQGFPSARGCRPFSAEKEPLALSPGASNPWTFGF